MPKRLYGHQQTDQYMHNGSLRREEKEEVAESKELILRNNGQNFPNLSKEINMQIQEAQKTPTKMNPKEPTQRYIVIKLSKDKERLLKAGRHKCCKGAPIDYQKIS